ncbi:hypothetical protein C6501_12565 [Candidatus Poribacteria bacterium]|nr:MAG: hypothetical protein C6501_12565 [Candidatus Poribacteria bacterium]
MIAHSRGVQIFQGIISIILGVISILLAIVLRQSTYPPMTLTAFFIIGLTLIFSGDYLINPFGMPVVPFKQQLLSEMCLIAYGAFYVNIGGSQLLRPLSKLDIAHFLDPVWIRRGISTIGILLIIGGLYGIYQLRHGELPEPPSE